MPKPDDTITPTLFDEIDEDDAIEIVSSPDQRLAPAADAVALAHPAGPEPAMMALARMAEGVQIIERAAEILTKIRGAALRLTGPGDWVLMKGKGAPDEAAFAMLRNSGARKIAPFFGIRCTAPQPTDAQGAFAPKRERGEDQEVQYSAWCEATCRLTSETIRVQIRRASSEDFIGRGAIKSTSQLVASGDLAESVATGLQTKAVRNLAGMKAVPVKELADAGIDVALIAKGSGFGTASDRGASAVASDDVKASRKQLGDEILRRVGGDKDAARDLLVDITKNPPKFKGFDTIERMAQGWQVENAWTRLRAHKVFGDESGKGGDS